MALSRKVSWDCLVPFRGSRYSVPAVYAGKRVWLMVSRGTHLLVRNAQRQIVAEHALSARHGTTVLIQEHYATLRRKSARVYDPASLEHAFATARTYNTYSHTLVRGILEQEGTTAPALAVPIAAGNELADYLLGDAWAVAQRLIASLERNFAGI